MIHSTTTRSDRAGLARMAALLAVLALLGACNTVRGVGQDVESAGEAISDTAEEAQN